MSGEPTTTFPLTFQQVCACERARQRVTCRAELRGTLDAARLHRSVLAVVSRHEILRACLSPKDATSLSVASAPQFEWSEEARENPDPAVIRDHVEAWLKAQVDSADEPQSAPLRVHLACVSESLHVLLLSLPAYCADSASINLVLSEIATAYAGEAAGEEPLQYGDYAVWQQEFLGDLDTQAGRDFWTNYNRRLEPRKWGRAWPSIVLAEPDGPVPRVEVVLDSFTARGLEDLAARHGTTFSIALLAAWHVFLARVSQLQTQLLRVAFDGRDYAEFQSAIGPFARYIPLQTTSSPETRFTELLTDLKRSVEEMQGWQQTYTGAPNSQELAPEVGFEYIELAPEFSAPEVAFVPSAVRRELDDQVLRLTVQHQGENCGLRFDYDPTRLNQQTVQVWSESFQVLLRGIAAEPDGQVSRFPLLDEAQREHLLEDWNQTATNYPRSRCMQELIEEQAARTPERIAVRCMERVLTYRELNEQANQLAHWLRAQRVGPDQRVGLCLDRSLDMVVGILGILKAGGAYVPLNAEHPPLRLAQQLEGAVALVTEASALEQTSFFGGAVVCLDRDRSMLRALPATSPAVETTSENLVYVLFTSGSTGVPKGVAARHRNLVNYTWFARSMLEVDRYPEGLQFSLVSTVCADVGLTCIYPALTSGGCLHVVPYDVAADSARYAEYASAVGIDILKIVPSHLLALLSAGGGKAVLPKKFVVVGGERLTRELMEKITAENVGCEVVNHYAPSETTCGSLTLRLSRFDWRRWQGASIPLGRPIANTRLYVLDANQEPVPVGAIGELYISGDGVSSGYIGDPKRTAERFLPDRFRPGLTMYRSGDVVRCVCDGNIEFLERMDDQVKIRGFRVELGEVLAALESHGGVKQAIVLARDGEHGKRSLAWAVGKSGVALSGDELREHVKQRLPEYMVPSRVVVLDKMPLTQNGKIDRQNLPEPEDVVSVATPRTPMECTVAEVWREVLELDCVGVEQNFFEVGGHSLLATQIVARLRERTGAPVPVRALFEHPTVARFAQEVERLGGAYDGRTHEGIRPVPRNRPLPLSLAQEAIWVHHQFDPNSSLYNIPRAYRLKGQLNTAALQRALNEIVRRHEVLRTVFTTHEGTPAQVVREAVWIPVATYDLSSLPADQREVAGRQMLEQEASRPFDLERGPVLRAHLIAFSPDEHVLLLVLHHIVSDAWSAGIFFRELRELYQAYAEGRESPLKELALQFGDYAVYERAQLQGRTLEAHREYWMRELRGAPEVLALPTDRPRPNVRSTHGGEERVAFSTAVSQAIKQIAAAEATTPFTVLIAAFQVLLWSYSGQEQFLVGSDFANRSVPEVEALIGFFVNVLPVRADLSDNASFREVLSRVKRTLMGIHGHQQLPLAKIVEAVQPKRSSSHNPLVQALFVYQNAPKTEKTLVGLEVEPVSLPATASKFDLAVFVGDNGESLVGHWVYAMDLFDRQTVLSVAKRFEDLLAKLIAQPDATISQYREAALVLEHATSLSCEEPNASEAELAVGEAKPGWEHSELTPTEQSVAEIWREILCIEKVSASENLFEIGGHSLIATQIAARLRQRFGRAIYVRTLFENPTIRQLAHIIDHDQSLLDDSKVIQKAPRRAVPLS